MGGGTVCLGVHKATRQAAGVDVGDRVDIVLERDDRRCEESRDPGAAGDPDAGALRASAAKR